MNDVLLNLSESAQIMRCSYSKAQRIARAGEMPFRKIGSNWVIARSVLFRELGLAQEQEVAKDAEIKQPA